MIRLKPSSAFISLTLVGTLTPWISYFVKWIVWRFTKYPDYLESYKASYERWLANPSNFSREPVLAKTPFVELEYSWVIPTWVTWTIPFFLLGLLAMYLLQKKAKTTIAYKKIYFVIGCAAVTGWVAMIVLCYNSWISYHGMIPLEILPRSAAIGHGIFTLVGLIIGFILASIIYGTD